MLIFWLGFLFIVHGTSSTVCQSPAPPNLETTPLPILEQYWRIGNSSTGFDLQGKDRCAILLAFWARTPKDPNMPSEIDSFSLLKAQNFLEMRHAATKNVALDFVAGRSVRLDFVFDRLDATFWAPAKDNPQLISTVMQPFL